MCKDIGLFGETIGIIQVLRKDVETSAAYSVTLGRAVFQRTALNFKSSMASAIPQFNFDVRMCGDGPEDGVEIIFREQFSKDTADEGKCNTYSNERLRSASHGTYP